MKLVSLFVATALCALFAFATNASAQGRFIVNQLSGRCIDVAGAPGTENGAQLQLWDCESSGRNPNGTPTDQLWEFLPDGFIRNSLSGRCIDVAGAPGTRNGAPIQLFDCEVAGGESDQYWRLR